jgi:DinB superfamily
MNDWGASVYGDPCRECGFTWAVSMPDALAHISNIPSVYHALLADRSGRERHPGLGWSVAEYVSHVADNLRIWAERLMGVVEGGPPLVGHYDENELAHARHYREIPLPAALWSLTRSVDDWLTAVEASADSGVVLVHPERGELTRSDVVLANAHDALHHQRDIERTLQDLRP